MNFSEIVMDWYLKNKRDLPWRNTKNPYLIWVSEVILQQTRVEQGLPFYFRFIENFPEIKSLAETNSEKLFKIWEGLGYYSRARNMQTAARQIMEKHQGIFPKEYQSILDLKGIGSYTAAAIASFCYAKPYPVLDGNVYRLISRFWGIESEIGSEKVKKQFMEQLDELIDKKHPDIFNQAIMEFGSQVCKPKSPDCTNCPLAQGCFALKFNKVSVLPNKALKKKSKKHFIHFFHIENDNKLLIQKRPDKGIWNNLFELPNAWTDKPGLQEMPAAFKETFGKEIKSKDIFPSFETSHQLTHKDLNAYFWKINGEQITFLSNSNIFEVEFDRIDEFAFHRLMNKYLEFLTLQK